MKPAPRGRWSDIRPTTKKFVQRTMDEMTGLIDNAALDTRVAWVRDLLDRVTVDAREEHAVAIWTTASDDGVNPVGFSKQLAPAVGFEPTTKRLTAARSTTELRRSEGIAGRRSRRRSRGRAGGEDSTPACGPRPAAGQRQEPGPAGIALRARGTGHFGRPGRP